MIDIFKKTFNITVFNVSPHFPLLILFFSADYEIYFLRDVLLVIIQLNFEFKYKAMAIVLETTIGDMTIDLFTDIRAASLYY